MCKNDFFQNSEMKKRTIRSLGTKIEFHAKFKEENNNLTYFLSIYN